MEEDPSRELVSQKENEIQELEMKVLFFHDSQVQEKILKKE